MAHESLRALTPIYPTMRWIQGILPIACIFACLTCSKPAPASTDAFPLGEKMGHLQYDADKLWLAGEAGNWDLARYYRDELVETVEDIERSNTEKEGVKINEFLRTNLTGPVQQMDEALAARNSALFNRAFDGMIQSCNRCHSETKRGFIRVTRPVNAMNRYSQDFRPVSGSHPDR